MIVFHELRLYWDWAGSNVGAMPACALVATIAAVVFRKPLGRLWERVKANMHSQVHDELRQIRETAEKAHQIAADTYRHHTGRDHPDAPDPK